MKMIDWTCHELRESEIHLEIKIKKCQNLSPCICFSPLFKGNIEADVANANAMLLFLFYHFRYFLVTLSVLGREF